MMTLNKGTKERFVLSLIENSPVGENVKSTQIKDNKYTD